MPAFTFTMASGCTAGAGFIDILSLSGGATGADYAYELTGDGGSSFSGGVSAPDLPLRLDGLADEAFTVRVSYANPDGGSGFSERTAALSCAGSSSGGTGPDALVLVSLTAANETATLNDGSASIRVSGGVPPLTASIAALSLSHATTAGTNFTFTSLPPGTYAVRVTDSATPTPAYVEGSITIAPYVAPVTGCTDEYADNYNPEATEAGSCSYTPNWRSAWGPTNVAVRVAAVAGQVPAYTTALLRIGFRAGHVLAADRPLGAALSIRATVGPDGYAVFRLGPYLRAALGAEDEAGGRRLDLNSPTASTSDLYVGFELRRPNGELLSHGYALNAAVPDADLQTGVDYLLTPFASARVPSWGGVLEYAIPYLGERSAGQYGTVDIINLLDIDYLPQPCPLNALPVAWLAPGGGYGYWVFQGRPALGDEVGEGQAFNEATTGERRWSQRGESRRTITATSGVFKGTDLMEGLRTLWGSPQVWYRPKPGGPWVAITIEPGSFPAGRLGVNRQQVSISFTEAQASYAQGQ